MKVTFLSNGNLVVIAHRLSPHMASPIINNFHDLQNNILHLDTFGIENDRDTNLYNHSFLYINHYINILLVDDFDKSPFHNHMFYILILLIIYLIISLYR